MGFTRLMQLLSGLGFNMATFKRGTTKLGYAAVLIGTGTPEGQVTAPMGTLYVNRTGAAGTMLYAKVTGTGNTGWLAYTAA